MMVSPKLQQVICAVMLLAELQPSAASEIFINGYTPKATINEDGPTTVYQCEYDFTKCTLPPKELQLTGSMKRHDTAPQLNGYNGDFMLKLETPGQKITRIEFSLPINGQDERQRDVEFQYSVDGKIYKVLSMLKSVVGKTNTSAFDMPENDGCVFLRYQRKYDKDDINGRYGYIVASGLTLKVSAQKKESSEPEIYSNLKEFFPTGVFWGWERTKGNAELAGMELWAFVDKEIGDFKKQGCNTFWFVNIYPGEDMKKLLKLGEKHNVKMLVNTSAVPLFNSGMKSIANSEDLAAKTIAEIGDSKALLAYVLKDEPLPCSLGQINYLYKLMKRMDSYGRDSVVVTMNRQSQTYAEESVLPIASMDIYYFGHKKTKYIPATTMIPAPEDRSQYWFRVCVDALNVAAERHNKHFWMMPQAFHDIWGRHWFDRKKKSFIVYPDCFLNWRMPTEAEMRWQIWEALRLGSKGVIFYVSHPAVPLTFPPEEVSENDKTGKFLVAEMDKASAKAKSWKTQGMTTEKFELEDADALTWPGGEPTKQMLVMGEEFRMLRKNARLLLTRRTAEFPVFFSYDNKIRLASFDILDRPGRRLGIAVNDNLNETGKSEILVPANTLKVTDLTTEKELPLKSEANSAFKSCSLELKAGGGTLLLAEFINQEPGILFFHENFSQYDQFLVRLDRANVDIAKFGGYGAFARNTVCLKTAARPKARGFVIDNLTNRKSAGNTILMNLNNTKADGIAFVQLSGFIQGAEIRAVNNEAKQGEETNVNHLREEMLSNVEYTSAGKVSTILSSKDSWSVPIIIPVGTTSLEVYLGSGTQISDVRVWFVPNAADAK